MDIVKKYKLILPASIVLGSLILGGFFYANEVNKRNTIKKIQAIQEEEKRCKFSLTDIKENRYQEDKEAYSVQCNTDDPDVKEPASPAKSPGGYQSIFKRLFCSNGIRNYPARHYTYWEINGMLKNKSYKNQHLESIILKIYTDDDRKILLSEGYIDVKKDLTSNQSFPFQVRANINRDSEISKYFNKDDKVKIDIYPHFSSCNY